MNTAWVLILAFWPGSNAGTAITIENLASLDECNRVAKIAIEWNQGSGPTNWVRKEYKCIEVIRK
jgi:hypothetical protein